MLEVVVCSSLGDCLKGCLKVVWRLLGVQWSERVGLMCQYLQLHTPYADAASGMGGNLLRYGM